jgi:hypothetical protein
VLQALCVYRLIDPGSEWRYHRQCFEQSAMADLLGSDSRLAESNRLCEVHERLLAHKSALFTHLKERWRDLFNAKFEVLLYDLTSTYFESDPPFPEGDKRKCGYSRDKRRSTAALGTFWTDLTRSTLRVLSALSVGLMSAEKHAHDELQAVQFCWHYQRLAGSQSS